MYQQQPVFQLVPMSIEHAETICTWRYLPPYHCYNWRDWHELFTRQEEFGDEAIRQQQYISVMLDEQLTGFAQFFPLLGVSRLGLGMRPDLCGSGWGETFVKAIVAEAIRRKPEEEIDLEVHVWNQRASSVYKRVGFEISDTYDRLTPHGLARFHCMVYKG